MKKSKITYIAPVFLFVLFVLFTVCVKIIDVEAVGPEGSEVGFGALNAAVASALPYNEILYKISSVLGYMAIALAGCLCVWGAVQLVMRRSLFKVDRDLISLGIVFVITFVFYIVFEKVVINCRPVILDAAEGLEASYPSSHTLLGAVVSFSTAIFINRRASKDDLWGRLFTNACLWLGVLIILTRIFSGVHWLTDIIASIILSGAIIALYIGISKK